MVPLLANSFQFAKDDNTTQWVVLSVGILATLWLVIRPMLKSRRRDPLEERPVLGLAQQRQLERDMNNLMVEMLDTARQMAAQLETRAAKLEALMEEADRKLEALRQATATSATGASTTSSLSTAGAVQPAEMQALAATPMPAAPPPPPETPPDPRHAEIYAMADQGRAPTDIARSLGLPNGEIELILALRRH